MSGGRLPRLSILDLLHRGLVLSLFGISVGGIYLGWAVHRDTLRRGRGILMAAREAEAAAVGIRKLAEEEEAALAEAAQAALQADRTDPWGKQ